MTSVFNIKIAKVFHLVKFCGFGSKSLKSTVSLKTKQLAWCYFPSLWMVKAQALFSVRGGQKHENQV